MHTSSPVPREIRAIGVPWGSPAFVFLAGLSRGSRPTQIVALRHVAGFFGATVSTMKWETLDVVQVVAVRSWLAERFAPATANRALSAVRGVLRAAARLELVPHGRVSAVLDLDAVPGRSAPAGRALEPEELRELLTALRSAGSPSELRTAAAVALCYGAGLRRAEATGLELEQLAGDRSAVRLWGKGNVERLVPLPMATRRALGAWIEVRGSAAGWLLCRLDPQGNAHPADAVLPSNVYTWCQAAARLAGVARFSPHDLRRTYVGDLLDQGADLASVQALVGHADPATTARYDRRPARAREAAVMALDRLPWAVEGGAPPNDAHGEPLRELGTGRGKARQAAHRPRLETRIGERAKPEREKGPRKPAVPARRPKR